MITTTLAALLAAPSTSSLAAARTTHAADASAPPHTTAHGVYHPAACNHASDSDRPSVRCYAEGLADSSGKLVQDDAAPPAGAFGPAEIQSAYGLRDAGAGQLVATVDAFGYDAAESDLAVFRAHYGLPPCTTANGCFTKIDQRGGTDYPAQNEGWSVETALDLDAISSACPRCKILLVQADNESPVNLGAAVDTAAARHPLAISNSYGFAGENDYQVDYDSHYDHPGIAVTVSSGDLGGLQSWPATNPNVVAVGGTYLQRDGSTRGWDEQAWSDAGSGCSLYEPRPDFQRGVDTGCPDTRATADVSADADPASGLAVYNTLGQDGWAQWGGTSLASPLVSAMYALAGAPVPGTYPVTYPYRAAAAGALNDITEGSAGFCTDQLCNARPGWDGPTGLGTPRGLAALTLGAYGYLTGQVTRGKGHAGLAGITVTATDAAGTVFSATADASGHYRLAAPYGRYTVAASAFGYTKPPAVPVTIGSATAPVNFALSALATRTVSGTVTDVSGQGWPVYARITVDGDPHGAVFTDPYSGQYQVQLPVGADYTLRASPAELPGYAPASATVSVPPAGKGHAQDVRRNLALTVDADTCTAPGYDYHYSGLSTGFEGWPGSDPQDGWRMTDDAGSGKTWAFDDPGAKGNLTGGSGGFAIVDGWYFPGPHDTSLISPSVDLSDQSHPVIGFDTDYSAWDDQTADVYVSIDGGTTWSDVWQARESDVQGHVEVPVPQAAGKADVRVKFRYTGQYANWWQLDNVYVGARACVGTGGGLVAGTVADDNTSAPVVGASVATSAHTGTAATSVATPDDAAVADGFYWLYSPQIGRTALTASGRNYGSSTATAPVRGSAVVRQDWRLQAGRLVARPGTIAGKAKPGAVSYQKLRLTNTGSRTLHVDLVEQDRGFTSAAGVHASTAPGAPLQRIAGPASPVAFGGARGQAARAHASGTRAAVAQSGAAGDAAWSNLPDYPTPIMDNLVADNDGVIYSVGGVDGSTTIATGYSYDAAAGTWHRIADLPQPLEAPVGGFVGGRLYAAGGWDGEGTPLSSAYAYDPGTNRWSRVADLPTPVSAGAAASVGGRLYVVGGCTTAACDPASVGTYRYDPRSDRWTQLADYPAGVAFLGCAGVGEGVVCAGGLDPVTGEATAAAYQYVAGNNQWTQVADLPYSNWAMAYAGQGGKLQVVGGVVNDSTSNQAAQFDPTTGAWSALPNANRAVYRGGGACGLSVVGGSVYSFLASPYAETLPGGEACVSGADVGWLSESSTGIDVAPGRTVSVTVALGGSAAGQPGRYDARLAFVTDTPYNVAPVPVALTVR